MEIKLSSEMGKNSREEMSRIFIEGFHQWLNYFSKDTETLTKAFAHMFLLDKFYIAIIDGEIAGITACTDGKTSSLKLDKKELKKHLGFLKGSIAGKVLIQYFENSHYPFVLESSMGSIEFVATSCKHLKQGVASSIIKNIMVNTHYQSYVLEVADTNEKAVSLYKKLGFYEIKRVKEKHQKQSGINEYIYMRYDRDTSL